MLSRVGSFRGGGGASPPLGALKKQKKLKKINRFSVQNAKQKEHHAEQMKKRRPEAVAFPPTTKVFNPHADWRKRWDLLIMMLLVFCALVTPTEIAFWEEVGCTAQCCAPSHCFLYILNHIINIVFIVDMCIIFQTAFFSYHLGRWVTNRSVIASSYMSSWFPIDLLSVIPFEFVGPSLLGDGANTRTLALVRLVRLLRLLKLLRMLKGAQIIKRWQNRVAVPYGSQVGSPYLSLYASLSACVCCSHHLHRRYLFAPRHPPKSGSDEVGSHDNHHLSLVGMPHSHRRWHGARPLPRGVLPGPVHGLRRGRDGPKRVAAERALRRRRHGALVVLLHSEAPELLREP